MTHTASSRSPRAEGRIHDTTALLREELKGRSRDEGQGEDGSDIDRIQRAAGLMFV